MVILVYSSMKVNIEKIIRENLLYPVRQLIYLLREKNTNAKPRVYRGGSKTDQQRNVLKSGSKFSV